MPRPRAYYIAPTYSQAKKVAWDYAKHYSASLPEARCFENELRIDYAGGRRLQLLGAENVDALRGIYADEVVLDEFAFMSGEVWNKIIRPALSDRDGRATFISSVQGRNEFYKLYQMAQASPDDWFSMNLRASQSEIIATRELAALRREMPEPDYLQEYENDFDVAAKGSYYGSLISQADAEGRITGVPVDGAALIDTAWDLGIGDSTAIWFVQAVGRELHAVDYYEASGQPLSHYAALLKRKGYDYGDHWLPHDADARELGTGKSRAEVLEELGVTCTVAPKLGVDDGIQAVRTMLPRFWFDKTKCADGVEKLRQYRSEYDEKRQVLSNRPLHDFTSHCFTGDTEILTRYGKRQIKDLPACGEVLTLCGWKPYHSPRLTRANAQLVAVAFKDGVTVRCTPDHLFLTGEGWKSAESLQAGSSIRSCLTLSRSISMAVFTGFGQAGDTLRAAARSFTAMFGGRRSAIYRMAAISTIGIATRPTTASSTSNAWIAASTSDYPAASDQRQMVADGFRTRPVRRQLSGIAPKLAVFGTSGTRNAARAGRNGSESHAHVLIAARNFLRWCARRVAGISFVGRPANPRIISSVEPLALREDVWCLTVPEGEAFALSNGAVVHNCADAFRMFCMAHRDKLKLASRADDRARLAWVV